MPELPEVEIIARQLREVAVGKTIVTVECSQPKMLNLPLSQFQKRAGGPIIGAARRGKSAILCEDDGSIWLHLGLRAEVRMVPAGTKGPQPMLSFFFDDGSELRMAKVFMGRAHFVFPGEFDSRWSKLGVEPLGDGFTPERLAEILASKPRTSIKVVLMDQSLIAGIGNIYADEALRQAGLNPLLMSFAIPMDGVVGLHKAIKDVLAAAIRAGGEVGYADLYGRGGGFEPAVHGRSACGVCGSPVVAVRAHGRTGYYCSHCNPR